jgi:hypothetical protein
VGTAIVLVKTSRRGRSKGAPCGSDFESVLYVRLIIPILYITYAKNYPIYCLLLVTSPGLESFKGKEPLKEPLNRPVADNAALV